MMQPLSEEQILSHLCQYYRDDYNRLLKPLLRSNEDVIWSGNWSYEKTYSVYPTGLGYLIVTNIRVFRVRYEADERLFRGRKLLDVTKDSWADGLPAYPLTGGEKKSRQVTERPLNEIKDASRQEHIVNWSETPVIELDINLSSSPDWRDILYFDYQQGTELYDLLTEIIYNRTASSSVIPPNLPELLQKLEELHNYQVIPDEVYEAAKRKLLG